MKPLFLVSLLVLLSFSTVLPAASSDGYSLKDLEKGLKSDSSEQANANLARDVLKNGVTFQYTAKRERSLRKWGANDELIAAIWQSIVDKREEFILYRDFMNTHNSGDKQVRKRALENGKTYLSRFEASERFRENVARVQREIRILSCEFDPELGC